MTDYWEDNYFVCKERNKMKRELEDKWEREQQEYEDRKKKFYYKKRKNK